ncbi:MAG: hypothetical protein HY908_32870 [Myxococcales bacterium]|nr:hypothetical protein [Myxococcales bacterium]
MSERVPGALHVAVTARRVGAVAGAGLALGCASSLGLGPDATGATGAPSAEATPLAVFAEGLCPKLSVYAAGDRAFFVYGTYGLDATAYALGAARDAEVAAAQSFAPLDADGPVRDATLFAGLPVTADGWVPGDLELGGLGSSRWLTRVETGRGSAGQGVLYERRRLYYGWHDAAWALDARAVDAATQGMLAPELPEASLCSEPGAARFASHATARLPSGDLLVAGRCEDAERRAEGGVLVASFTAGERAWRVLEAPASPLLRTIVNLELVLRGRRDAYLYGYPPYETDDAPVYLVHYDGSRWSEVEVPFEGPLVSMTATDDGSLWAVARWRELWRRAEGAWRRVAVPPPAFVTPAPEHLRLVEVHAAAGALWLHAAYPVELDADEGGRPAARGHALYTTRPVDRPLYCDRRRPAAEALGADAARLRGAEER